MKRLAMSTQVNLYSESVAQAGLAGEGSATAAAGCVAPTLVTVCTVVCTGLLCHKKITFSRANCGRKFFTY